MFLAPWDLASGLASGLLAGGKILFNFKMLAIVPTTAAATTGWVPAVGEYTPDSASAVKTAPVYILCLDSASYLRGLHGKNAPRSAKRASGATALAPPESRADSCRIMICPCAASNCDM